MDLTLLASLWPMILVFILIAVALYLFTTERFPIEITSLGVLVTLGATGILGMDAVFSGFSNPATLTVLMMFILSAGVLHSGLLDRIADAAGDRIGRKTGRQVLLLGLAVGPVSAFINNTAAVAVTIPLVSRLAHKVSQSVSKLFMPLSFAAMLGGTMTLIGTSTNLLASALREDAGLGAFGMFEFTKAGVIVFGVGMLYLVLVGHRLTPARIPSKPVDERYRLRRFTFRARVPEGSPLVRKVAGSSELAERYDAHVLTLTREGVDYDVRWRVVRYEPGDVLVLDTTRANLERLIDTGIVELEPISPGAPGPQASEEEAIEHAELLVHHESHVRRKHLGDLDLQERFGVRALAILSRGRLAGTRLDDHALREGDVILVQGHPRDIAALTSGPEFYVLGGPDVPLRRPHKIPHALLILAGVVGLAAFDVAPIVLTATGGAVLMVMTGVLRIEDMYRNIRWDVVFLLAGLIPLGLALDRTGGAALLANALAGVGAHIPPLLLLTLVYLLTTLLTEIVSNNAAVVLIVPVVLDLATALSLNPTTLVLATMFAASTSFLTPVGYQTNLLVMGPGGYRYTDFARVGAPLNALMLVTTPLVLNAFWPL